jgi:hypothetical protein
MKDILIYLAAPYTHTEDAVEKIRELTITFIAGRLEKAGYSIFSPITHSARLGQILHFEGDYDTWKKTDRLFVNRLDEVWVVALEGWHCSKGVKDEMAYAQELGKTVRLVQYSPLTDKIEVKEYCKPELEIFNKVLTI